MKTTLIREEFLKAVTISNRFIPLKPSIPVLGNILIKATKGSLELSSTNLESSVYLKLPAKSEETWDITVPAKILHDFASNSVDKEISLEVDKDSLKLSSGDIDGNLSGIAASEFPTLPQPSGEGATFAYQELSKAVNDVSFAASVDNAKPILTGVYLSDENGKTIIVATDGYRLAKKILAIKYNFDQVVLPAKALVEALRIAGEMEQDEVTVTIAKEQNQVILEGDNFQISSRLLDGTYPQFQAIIPSKFISEFSVNREKLTAGIRACAVFARDIGNVVKMTVSAGEIFLTANTAQVGDGSAKVNGTNKGEDLVVAFNSKYVLDGLSALKADEVTLKFSGATSATMITAADDFFYIVMPVKTQ